MWGKVVFIGVIHGHIRERAGPQRSLYYRGFYLLSMHLCQTEVKEWMNEQISLWEYPRAKR